MSPRDADKLIGKTIVITDKYGDTAKIKIVSRDRWCVNTADGGRYDRTDIRKWQIVERAIQAD